MRIIIPFSLPTLNEYSNAERTHKHAAARMKKQATTQCAWVFAGHPPIARYDLIFNFEWYAINKKIDPDNISFGKKFILDGMVMAGFIQNDGWKNVRGFSDSFYVDKKTPRVEIVIGVN